MATSPLFGWEEPDDTDLVKDGAAAIRTLGNAIDTSMGDLLGGTSGQVLSKNSNTNMDFTWVTSDDANAIQNAIVDAKGDLITATAADTPARLAVGTNGQTLVADSSTATGLKWATPASGTTFVGASVYKTASQTINNATETALTFNAEDYDTDAFHDNSTNNTRMTIPTGKGGKYLITATTAFFNNATGQRTVYIYKNGSTLFNTAQVAGVSGSIDAFVTTSYVVNVSAADYLEIKVFQNSGGTLTVFPDTSRTAFQISYLGA